MASLHTGSDELVYIQTDKVSVTIKGPASHPHNQGAEHSEKESFLKVFCDESYEINLKGDTELVSKQVISTVCLGEYRTVPLFYEQQRYEIVIESLGSSPVEFWHDNYNVRNKVTSVGRSEKILSGVINFGNEIGMSDLIVRVNGTEYLRLVIEVFPSKISYKMITKQSLPMLQLKSIMSFLTCSKRLTSDTDKMTELETVPWSFWL